MTMKVKEYFKSLGKVALVSPFLLAGIIVLAVGIFVKSAGMCLMGDFEAATKEIKDF